MEVPGKHVVYWTIRCVNRQTKEMFDRRLLLDESKVSEADRPVLFSLVEQRNRHSELLRFRECFTECTEQQFADEAHGASRFSTICITGYFEDDKGQGLEEVGLIQILSGQEEPIILGNSRSVLRLGPTPIKDKAGWSIQKANDIAHYLDLCKRLTRSRWFSEKMSLQISPALELEFPDDDATDAAILAVRQFLEKRDDVFNHACKHYFAHASDVRKASWIKAEQSSFLGARNGKCFPQVGTLTNEQALELYAYGARRIHRDPNKKQLPEQLAQMIQQHGRERIMFAFGAACKQMLGPPLTSANVIAQDYRYWVEVEGCCDSPRMTLTQLFEQ